MFLEAVHMDCAVWSCRAKVLASTATDASVFYDRRYPDGFRVVHILAKHSDSPCRAVASTIAATYAIFVSYTKIEIYYRSANMNCGFLFWSYW